MGGIVGRESSVAGLMDDAALLSFEHQEYLREVLGVPAWHVAYEPPRFEFSGERELVCTRFHLLGSAAPGPQSWLWSWANPDWYPDEVTELARTVRDYGVRHGIPLLSEPEVPFSEFPEAPTDPLRVTWLVGELAKAISDSWTWYSAPVGGGTRLAVLVEHPDLAVPLPDMLRVSRVIQAADRLGLPDHRRAIHSYAVRRGLRADFDADRSRLYIEGPELQVAVAFDERGLYTALSAGKP
ncbi:DUF6882 domain-containing protein [Nocardia wallacei]|uniref:DUF6882 domain-containing protein n=1 Tax=Nocardia wallacei TaxID=480035 RepID=UPI0024566CC5|nr:DUF6882 domain-containing protein [Nocardia wallacei]